MLVIKPESFPGSNVTRKRLAKWRWNLLNGSWAQ